MSDAEDSEPKIIVDSDWKSQVQAEKQALEEQAHAEREPAEGSADELPPLPPASIATLVTTLATQAAVSLGHMNNPITGDVQIDKEQAKHFIDTLQVIEEKTQGNLTPEESQLLTTVLHQLRLAFVQPPPGAPQDPAAPPEAPPNG